MVEPMLRVIDLDQYLVMKEKDIVQVFIFLLDGEYSHLGENTSLFYGFNYPVYLVRMTEDEFHSMDISVHPKVFCTKDGKEFFELNGIPTARFLKHKMKSPNKSK